MKPIYQDFSKILISNYLSIIDLFGEPDELYKYDAINHFQEHWNLDSEDFSQMFKSSFAKKGNLIFRNSYSFINGCVKRYTEETREMFRHLFNESLPLDIRINKFQSSSEELLERMKIDSGDDNIRTQQDERTISFYLAMRYPAKYPLYKSDYYKDLCDTLEIENKKPGHSFIHYIELVDDLRYITGDKELVSEYRQYYPTPEYDDTLIMLQNIFYLANNKKLSPLALQKVIRQFSEDDIRFFFNTLETILTSLDIKINDQRLHYNIDNKWLKVTIGQRDVFEISTIKNRRFGIIMGAEITSDYFSFKGKPVAFYNYFNNEDWLSKKYLEDAIHSMKYELEKTSISSYRKHTKPIFEEVLFNSSLREEIFINTKFKNKMNSSEEIEITSSHNEPKMSNHPLNQILYGPPGTGKTYKTKQIAVEIIDGKAPDDREELSKRYQELLDRKQIQFTTFHQSMSYEDFMEGIKPKVNDEDSIYYQVENGIFKDICELAKSDSIDGDSYNYMDAWSDLLKEAISHLDEDKVLELPLQTTGMAMNIVRVTSQGNLHLVPKNSKSGLSYIVSCNRTEKLNNAIDDLAEVNNIDKEFRKIIGGSNSSAYWSVLNYIKNKFSEKVSKNKINHSQKKNYVIIIDEINRGNVSSIFGELITLIEPDKRCDNEESIEIVLPYSKDRFSVPNNVYIIGTMNTADRSVEALDTALRRRFSFEEIAPNPSILDDCENVSLESLLSTINDRIEILLDKNYQIGHSYFLGISSIEGLNNVFKDKIIPLLEEYFYGDFGKIGLVLGNAFVTVNEANQKTLASFDGYDIDFIEDKRIYGFTPSEDWTTETFVSIYNPNA